VTRRPFVPSLLVAALLLAGCDEEASGPWQVRENAFAWNGVVAPGATVSVRDFRGDIDVRPSADDTVRVTARLEWRKGDPDAALHFSGALVGGDAVICAIWGDGRCTREDYTANIKFGNDHDARVFFTVEVPAGVRLELSNISGNVAAVATAPVFAKTMNGDVRVATSVGPVQGETLNGSVDIRMSSLAGADSVIAKTLNGEALIYLPAVDDAVLDLSVGNGTVSSDFGIDPAAAARGRKIQMTIGAGSRVILAHALNGAAALRKLDAEGKSH
jgi:hypothetical protein